MRFVLLCAWVLAGCAASSPSRAPLAEAGELVALEDVGPAVGDAPPRLRLAFRGADGALTPVALEAAAFVPRWREGGALVDPERRLYEVAPGGAPRMLAAGVTALASDGARLAYVVQRDLEVELRVDDGEGPRTWARGLSSAAMLRVDGARVRFVGAVPGGVAGVWWADADGARCVTNCALRTGEPWGDAFVPPPEDPSQLEAP
ncbi:MAG: hypothetical protein KF729_32330 [Sandaracinaceae bacterium]|nr:hypothetical protein [Sandaracinaceae bacterium]